MAKIKWTLDPTHSDLGFKIRHLMITNVSGFFGEFEVEVLTDGEDFKTAQVSAKIKTASVSTNNVQRDQHLRNGDFFDVEQYPEILFTSDRVEPIDDENFILHGHLTMKGVTKPVTLNVEYSSTTNDPWGTRRAGFAITGKIKRTDFGLSFNKVLESGNLGLGEDVKINSEVQIVKQQEAVVAESI